MKYIRTKDGRVVAWGEHGWIKGDDISVVYGGFCFGYNEGHLQRVKEVLNKYCNTDILKYADTIEELCDEFVLVNKYRFKKPKTATELEKDFDEMRSFYTSKYDKIYGAIWIVSEHGEPILKSVSKMNEKGELELL